MIKLVKGILKSALNKFGYLIISKKYVYEFIPEMASPNLPQKLLENCKMLASRELILKNLPKGGVMAEVGVASGYFTEKILKDLDPEKLFAIDLYNYPNSSSKDETHEEFYQNKFKKEIQNGALEMKKGYSWEVLKTFPDHYFDYIYLDADHSYDSVVQDLEQIKTKIKSTGIIQFNDYTTFNPIALMAFGVQKAVNEFMLQENYQMTHYSLNEQNFCDVVIKKIDL